MSRKSKVAMSREKLEILSDCPVDIFNKIEADEDIFEKIASAENGDLSSVSYLSSLLFSTYSDDRDINKALCYFLKKGVDKHDVLSAKNLIAYASMKDECLDYVEGALKLLSSAGATVSKTYEKDARLKSIIRSAQDTADLEGLKKKVRELKPAGRAYAELYLTYKSLELSGKYDSDDVKKLLIEASLPPILDLPSFSDKKTVSTDIKEGWTESLISALHSCSLDCWQDFWLRCIYEYCVIYLDNNFTDFAEEISIALEHRRFSQKAKLHALAFIEYILDNTPKDSEKYRRLYTRYEKMLGECILDGTISNHEERVTMQELMKEAAYTSEYTARKVSESGIACGEPIKHVKNRYTLSCVLSNHAKRSNKHMWETVLSIKTDTPDLPIFQNIKISERRNTVNRGGAVLEQTKKRSQILCNGEIAINEKVSPFILDLILDISYVSTTKCENLEIKVKRSQRQGDYTVLYCQLLLD